MSSQLNKEKISSILTLLKDYFDFNERGNSETSQSYELDIGVDFFILQLAIPFVISLCVNRIEEFGNKPISEYFPKESQKELNSYEGQEIDLNSDLDERCLNEIRILFDKKGMYDVSDEDIKNLYRSIAEKIKTTS